MSCCSTRYDSNHVALNSANGLSITFSTIATVTLIAISIIALAPALPIVSTLAAVGFGLKTFALIGAASSFLALVAHTVAAVYSGKVIRSEKQERAQRPNLLLMQQNFQTATTGLQTATEATNNANTALTAAANLFTGAVPTISTALSGLQKAEAALTKAFAEKGDLPREIRAFNPSSKEVSKEKGEKEYKAPLSAGGAVLLPSSAVSPKSSLPTPLSGSSATTPPKEHPAPTVTVVKSPIKDTPTTRVDAVPVSPPPVDVVDGRPRSKSGRVMELAEKHAHEIEKVTGHGPETKEKKDETKS